MTEWTIHTSDNSSIIGDFVTSSPSDLNLISKGDTATYEFVEVTPTLTIDSGDTFTVESGETLEKSLVIVNGTLVIDGTLRCDKLDNNGTVDLNGTLDINDKYELEYTEIKPYANYSGKFNVTETLSSKQRYSENIPPNNGPNTLLVGIEPQTELDSKDIFGYWGLISNIADIRNQPLSNGPRIEIEITVLAPYEQYDDHTAVQNDLEV